MVSTEGPPPRRRFATGQTVPPPSLDSAQPLVSTQPVASPAPSKPIGTLSEEDLYAHFPIPSTEQLNAVDEICSAAAQKPRPSAPAPNKAPSSSTPAAGPLSLNLAVNQAPKSWKPANYVSPIPAFKPLATPATSMAAAPVSQDSARIPTVPPSTPQPVIPSATRADSTKKGIAAPPVVAPTDTGNMLLRGGHFPSEKLKHLSGSNDFISSRRQQSQVSLAKPLVTDRAPRSPVKPRPAPAAPAAVKPPHPELQALMDGIIGQSMEGMTPEVLAALDVVKLTFGTAPESAPPVGDSISNVSIPFQSASKAANVGNIFQQGVSCAPGLAPIASSVPALTAPPKLASMPTTKFERLMQEGGFEPARPLSPPISSISSPSLPPDNVAASSATHMDISDDSDNGILVKKDGNFTVETAMALETIPPSPSPSSSKQISESLLESRLKLLASIHAEANAELAAKKVEGPTVELTDLNAIFDSLETQFNDLIALPVGALQRDRLRLVFRIADQLLRYAALTTNLSLETIFSRFTSFSNKRGVNPWNPYQKSYFPCLVDQELDRLIGTKDEVADRSLPISNATISAAYGKFKEAYPETWEEVLTKWDSLVNTDKTQLASERPQNFKRFADQITDLAQHNSESSAFESLIILAGSQIHHDHSNAMVFVSDGAEGVIRKVFKTSENVLLGLFKTFVCTKVGDTISSELFKDFDPDEDVVEPEGSGDMLVATKTCFKTLGRPAGFELNNSNLPWKNLLPLTAEAGCTWVNYPSGVRPPGHHSTKGRGLQDLTKQERLLILRQAALPEPNNFHCAKRALSEQQGLMSSTVPVLIFAPSEPNIIPRALYLDGHERKETPVLPGTNAIASKNPAPAVDQTKMSLRACKPAVNAAHTPDEDVVESDEPKKKGAKPKKPKKTEENAVNTGDLFGKKKRVTVKRTLDTAVETGQRPNPSMPPSDQLSPLALNLQTMAPSSSSMQASSTFDHSSNFSDSVASSIPSGWMQMFNPATRQMMLVNAEQFQAMQSQSMLQPQSMSQFSGPMMHNRQQTYSFPPEYMFGEADSLGQGSSGQGSSGQGSSGQGSSGLCL
ncbi:hypothetical protein C8J56DRAFT_886156 [Mycena floridula]|nr:hypothetical protein C8J56DRAFT_886156 [Mycena floridula]